MPDLGFRLATCARCDLRLPKWDDQHEGLENEILCQDCWEAMYLDCEHCGKTLKQGDSFLFYHIFRSSYCYCPECKEALFFKCDCCGGFHLKENTRLVQGFVEIPVEVEVEEAPSDFTIDYPTHRARLSGTGSTGHGSTSSSSSSLYIRQDGSINVNRVWVDATADFTISNNTSPEPAVPQEAQREEIDQRATPEMEERTRLERLQEAERIDRLRREAGLVEQERRQTEHEANHHRQITEGSRLCESCYNDNYIQCAECDEVVRKSNSSAVPHTQDGHHTSRRICNECFAAEWGNCYHCGGVRRLEDLFYDGDVERHYCANCESARLIRYYSFRPRPRFMSTDKEANPFYMGIELEVECAANRTKTAKEFYQWLKLNKIDNRFYLKDDSSIDDGFEIVTHPSTLKYSKTYKYKEMFTLLKQLGCGVKNNCGLHVHVCRNKILNSQAIKMVTFYQNCQSQITKISERKPNRHWKYLNHWDATAIKHYNKNTEFRNSERYRAINIRNTTIEFRHMRATLDHKKFIVNMQFIDALCHFVQTVSIMSMDWAQFIEYVSHSNRYTHLMEYIRTTITSQYTRSTKQCVL